MGMAWEEIMNKCPTIKKLIETVDTLKKENILIIMSVFAICEELKQLVANGAASKTRDDLQDYIIKN